MLWIWRSVLIWLFVLAMPVQGMTTLGMQPCATAHEHLHPGGVAASVVHGHGDGHERQLPVVATDAASAAASEALALALARPTAAASADSTGDAKCSACAACCLALGLPNRTLHLPVLPGAASLAPLPMAAVPSFIPAGLDRPPQALG
ncbi:MAG: hypothetical protein MUF16_00380 [Burkholderiaceae bacterium]|jgi:hypothetical protein|nr:hypothetical protein [Burkholderiaceae bacterium]